MKFLKTLTDTSAVPVYGVFDADPDGLDILRCYAVGSKVSVRESSICRRIIWLPIDLCAAKDEHKLPLTLRDRQKVRGMMCKTAWTACCPGIGGYLEALQQMLMLNRKAEIPGIEDSGYLVDWLGSRLKC